MKLDLKIPFQFDDKSPFTPQQIAFFVFIFCVLLRMPYYLLTDSFIEGDSTGRSALAFSAFSSGNCSGILSGNWLPGGHWISCAEYLLSTNYADFPRLANLVLTSISASFIYLILNSILGNHFPGFIASLLFSISPHVSINSVSFLVEGYHVLTYLMSFYFLFFSNEKFIQRIFAFLSLAFLCTFRVEGIVLSMILSGIFFLQNFRKGLKSYLEISGTVLGIGVVEIISYAKYGFLLSYLIKSDDTVIAYYQASGIDALTRIKWFSGGIYLPFSLISFLVAIYCVIKKVNTRRVLHFGILLMPIILIAIISFVKVFQGTLIHHIRYLISYMLATFIGSAVFTDWIIKRYKTWGLIVSALLLTHFLIHDYTTFKTSYQYSPRLKPGFIESAARVRERNYSDIVLDRDDSWSQGAWLSYSHKPFSAYTCRLTNYFWEKDKSSEEPSILDCLTLARTVVVFSDGIIEKSEKAKIFLENNFKKDFDYSGYKVFVR